MDEVKAGGSQEWRLNVGVVPISSSAPNSRLERRLAQRLRDVLLDGRLGENGVIAANGQKQKKLWAHGVAPPQFHVVILSSRQNQKLETGIIGIGPGQSERQKVYDAVV